MPENQPNPIQVTKSSDNKVLKIALTILGILFLILLAEAGYYVYNNYIKEGVSPSSQEPDLSKPLVVDDEPIEVSDSSPIPGAGNEGVNFQVGVDAIAQLQSISSIEDYLTSGSVNFTYKGTVQSAFFTEEENSQFVIQIITEENENPVSIYFTDNELIDMEIYQIVDGERVTSSISNITRGKVVEINIDISLFEDQIFYDTIIEIQE